MQSKCSLLQREVHLKSDRQILCKGALEVFNLASEVANLASEVAKFGIRRCKFSSFTSVHVCVKGMHMQI